MITTKNKFGLLHSYDDQPSLIDDNGNKYWHINGVPSRLDISLPYIEMSDGEKHYRLINGGYKIINKLEEKWCNKDGLLHRDNDLPIMMKNGNKFWYINGVPSRLDISLPYIEMSNGYKEYNLEDGGHREISHKKEEWFNKDNLLHREDGPAYIFYGENRNIEYETYYLNNIEYTKQDYLEQTKDLNFCNKKP
jgi:hypothetical protein